MISSETPLSVPAADGNTLAWVEDERRRADVAGIAFAAFDRERTRFADGLGYADFGRGERVTPQTQFRGASISKLFTTMLVLREVDAGRISLDAPVNQYVDAAFRVLNRAGSPDQRVTVRHLLTHTAGLPESWKGLIYGNKAWQLLLNGRKLPRSLDDVIRGMRTVRAPGERIVYSNSGFALLGHMTARLNETRFEDLVRSQVLEPLAMRDTSFPLDPRGPGIATPYGHAQRGRRPDALHHAPELHGPRRRAPHHGERPREIRADDPARRRTRRHARRFGRHARSSDAPGRRQPS
jgi:CubicO group peptidase (beta-lactamase class C family)